MKGLLYKELAVLEKNLRSYLFAVAMVAVFYFVLKTASYLAMMVIMLTINVLFAGMAYDEQAEWNRLAMTMPVTRRDLIAAKYILMLGLLFGGLLLSVLLVVALSVLGIVEASLPEALAMLAVFGLLGLPMGSAVIYVSIKYGVQKARMRLILFYMLPIAAFALLPFLAMLWIDLPTEPTDLQVALALTAMGAALVALAVLFWHLACRQIEKKDW